MMTRTGEGGLCCGHSAQPSRAWRSTFWMLLLPPNAKGGGVESGGGVAATTSTLSATPTDSPRLVSVSTPSLGVPRHELVLESLRTLRLLLP
jgi:hypothetical protein